MLRRNSTKSQDLPRRKSTSSVKNVQLVHLHPDAAEHDAQSAAVLAFVRARDRASNNVAYWPPPRSNERPDLRRNRSSPERHRDKEPIRRQQSVRFVQPKGSTSRLGEGSVPYTPSRQGYGRSRANTSTSQSRAGWAQSTQSQSNASTSGTVFATKDTAGDHISALLAGEEYYTPEDNIASLPSSYSRLRKSRSMYTGSESGAPSDTRHNSQGLRAPRSMGFLRSRRGPSTVSSNNDMRSSTTAEPESIITSAIPRLARSQSSAQLHSRLARSDKVFKKTLRNTSEGAVLPRVEGTKHGSLRLKARQVSHNFKHKLKNFFGTMRSESDDSGFPPQQVEARKTYVTEIKDAAHDTGEDHSDGIGNETTTLSRVSSGIPSFHNIPLEYQLQSHQGSLESLHSEGRASDERSRVTSWSNSDATTCGTATSSQAEQGKQRLSVIKENGINHGSSHQRRPIFNHWTKMPEDVGEATSNTSTSPSNVQGQRLYSALMKRNTTDVSNQEQSPHGKVRKGHQVFVKPDLVPTRGSSRSVSSAETMIINHTTTFEPKCNITNITPFISAKHRPEPTDDPFVNSKKKQSATNSSVNDSSSSTVGAGRQRLSKLSSRSLTDSELRKGASPMKTLSTRSSAFFGSPECHLFRTRSPYRRAVRGSIQAAAKASPPKSPAFNPWKMSLPTVRIRRPSTESESDQKLAYDESIYSTDVEHAEVSHNTNNSVPDLPKPQERHGYATIFLDPPKYQSSKASPAHRTASSTSSIDWKSWLSANMSEIDAKWSDPERSQSKEPGNSSIDHPKGYGHVREQAQIDGEEEDDVISDCNVEIPDSANQAPRIVKGDSERAAKQSGHNRNNGHIHATLAVKARPVAASRLPVCNNILRSTPSSAQSKTSKDKENMPRHDACGDSDISKKDRSFTHTQSLSALKTQNQNVITPQRGDTSKPWKCAETKTPQSFPRQKIENVSPRYAMDTDSYAVENTGSSSVYSSPSRQSVGSKDMVEIFLDSRRRRIAGTDDTGAFI